MPFTSFRFFFFLAFVIFAYYIVPKKFQWAVLLVSSYAFYLYSGIENIFFILATTLFTYLSALFMQSMRNKNQKKIDSMGEELSVDKKREMKKAVAKKIHTVQVLTVLINLGTLACLKYLNLFIGTANDMFTLFRWDASIPFVNLIVPLGLSYYTFNCIGYLIDIGRGKYPAEKHLGKFALFTSFFPSVVQGPLNRFADVGAQLKEPHKLKYENLRDGALLILWGLFKKLVIADRVAAIAATVFSSSFAATEYNGSQILFGVLAYSFQIYGDFSGGTDITRGTAQMMDINLPLNFERPFFSISLADFWRRWHMSLGAWMREYVFYPVMLCRPVSNLSKKMRKKHGAYAGKLVPSVAAPMVVFFLIGIWHGITSQYIVNGLYNAILISGSVAMIPVYKKLIEKLHINTETFSYKLFQIARTTILLFISRIIVKAPSLEDALLMIKALFTTVDFDFLFGFNGEIYTYGVSQKEMSLVIFSILILLVVGVLQENGLKIRETLAKQNIFFRWFLILLFIAFILIFGIYGPGYNASSFIYGNF